MATSWTKGSTLETLSGVDGKVRFVCKSLIRKSLLKKNLTVGINAFTSVEKGGSRCWEKAPQSN